VRRSRELANNYANAIYEVVLEDWLSSLKAVGEALNRDATLMTSLRDPNLELARKQNMVRGILPEGTPEEVFNFVSLLLSKNHIDLLGNVVAQLERLARRGARPRVARVTSAVPLTDDEQEQLENQLTVRFGAGLDLQFVVDESILGGLTVRVGDEIIDASVAGKLAALRESLLSAE
jgi:F-type H+-transporting ATPase subunit delta